MITKHQIKLIKRLSQKKYRQQDHLFIVEGIKGINEFLSSGFELFQLFTTEAIFDAPESLTIQITETELKKISSLVNPNTALAIFKIPEPQPINQEGLIVALDAIRDPGNLGTIIRLCDWYGITELVCSNTTVDCYNSKVVQATMGSLTRVNINYLNLDEFITEQNTEIFGAFMDGQNVYLQKLPQKGILVMGNEANGISKSIEDIVNKKISIPQFGTSKTESLNVATATAILLSEFKRNSTET